MQRSQDQTYDDLLKRYLSGDITAQEEIMLIEAAKSDPFLMDAMEGYASLKDTDHQSVIEDLKADVKKRSTAKKKERLPAWLAVAATVLILISAGLWFLNDNSKQSDIAQVMVPSKNEVNIQAHEHQSSLSNESTDPGKEEMIPINKEITKKRQKPDIVIKPRVDPPESALVEDVAVSSPIEGESGGMSDQSTVAVSNEQNEHEGVYVIDGIRVKENRVEKTEADLLPAVVVH